MIFLNSAKSIMSVVLTISEGISEFSETLLRGDV